MKVAVNKDVCIGCGACQQIAEGVFEIGDDGLAQVTESFKNKEIPSDIEENVQDAIDSCPTGAIEEVE